MECVSPLVICSQKVGGANFKDFMLCRAAGSDGVDRIFYEGFLCCHDLGKFEVEKEYLIC